MGISISKGKLLDTSNWFDMFLYLCYVNIQI